MRFNAIFSNSFGEVHDEAARERQRSYIICRSFKVAQGVEVVRIVVLSLKHPRRTSQRLCSGRTATRACGPHFAPLLLLGPSKSRSAVRRKLEVFQYATRVCGPPRTLCHSRPQCILSMLLRALHRSIAVAVCVVCPL